VDVVTNDNARDLTHILLNFLHGIEDYSCYIIREEKDYKVMEDTVTAAAVRAARALSPFCVGTSASQWTCQGLGVRCLGSSSVEARHS
jgi:hypothetical protein